MLHALLTLTVNTLATLDTAFQIGYSSPDDSSVVAFPVKPQKGLLEKGQERAYVLAGSRGV